MSLLHYLTLHSRFSVPVPNIPKLRKLIGAIRHPTLKIRHPTSDLYKSDIRLVEIRHSTCQNPTSDIRLVEIQQIQFDIIVSQVGGELIKEMAATDRKFSFSRELISFLLFSRKWGLPLQCFVCVCLSWYKWLTGQLARLLLVKIGNRWSSKLCFI